jgi:ApaG protein
MRGLIERSLTNASLRASLEILTECRNETGMRTMQLWGVGLGIWQRNRQIQVDGDGVTAVLHLLQAADFAAFAPLHGGPRQEDPREHERPDDGRAILIICRIRVSLAGRSKESVQRARGEQSEELKALAEDLLAVGEGAASNGVEAESLFYGLEKLGRAELDPRVLRVLLHRKPTANEAAEYGPGAQLRLEGREATTRRHDPGVGYGREYVDQAAGDLRGGGSARSLRIHALHRGQEGRAVEQFYNLERVEWPGFISPFWTARATASFEEAPIRIVEYGDLLCSEYLYLQEQLKRLKLEFEGKMNIAFQFLPLEAKCPGRESVTDAAMAVSGKCVSKRGLQIRSRRPVLWSVSAYTAPVPMNDLPGSNTSEALTRGIRIRAQPQFDPSRSEPTAGQWFFLYTITIENLAEETVQLLTRHWIITDGNGHVEEVRGPGVVGEQPILAPGEAFQYTSGCPLPTEVGKMEGTYQMVTQSGEAFDAAIAPFTLAAPGLLH